MISPYLADLIQYAQSINSPYVYGGNNPRTGLDCSGYINILMRSVGLVGLREDLRAIDLYHRFSRDPHQRISIDRPTTGCLLFYGQSLDKISHVAFAVSPYSLMEAGGGDATTKTVELADLINARVRKVGVNHRSDRVAICYPCYPWEAG